MQSYQSLIQQAVPLEISVAALCYQPEVQQIGIKMVMLDNSTFNYV